MNISITISDKYELIALHRALLEAKFSSNPNDPAVVGSTHIASIANRVIAELCKLDPSWNEWRLLKNHKHIAAFISNRLSNTPKWNSFSEEEKASFIKSLASPFVLNESELKQFVKNGNA